jgi:hypothetical protein
VLAAQAAAPGVSDARAAEISRLIWNDRIDAAMTAFFITVVAIVLVDSARVWTRLTLGSGGGARNTQQAAA